MLFAMVRDSCPPSLRAGLAMSADLVRSGKLGVDATEKSALVDVAQPWPDEIAMSDEMRERVTRRWQEYGL